MRKLGQGRKSEVFELDDGRILKLMQPDAPGVAERETAILHALETAGLDAPRVSERVQREGRPGIVFDNFAAGRTLHEELWARPWRILRAARSLAEVHAAIHTHTCPALPDVREQIRRELLDAPNLDDELRDAALAALDTLPGGDTVCHFDLHSRNVLVTPQGIQAMDWDRAARGDPLADVAMTSLFFRCAPRVPGRVRQTVMDLASVLFCRSYLERYRGLRPFEERELERWSLPVLATLAARRGGSIPDQSALPWERAPGMWQH